MIERYQVRLIVYSLNSEAVNLELIQRGVCNKDIILGFRSPTIRKHLAAILDSQESDTV